MNKKAERAAAAAKAQAILDKAKTETRELTTDEGTAFDAEMAIYDSLTVEIDTEEAQRAANTARTETMAAAQTFLRSTPKPKSGYGEVPAVIGMGEKDVRKYSIIKAIRASISGDWRGAELEKEASDAVADLSGGTPRSFYLPYDVMVGRSMNAGVPADGGYLVETDNKIGSFIGMLQNMLLVKSLGATVLDGLTGNVDIPKKLSGTTGYWLSEGEDTTESDIKIGQVPLTMKTVAGYTELTRKWMKQTSVSSESFVWTDLAQTLAQAIDLAALFGTGADNQPLGLANQTGIGAVAIGTDGGPLTWKTIVDLESAVATANADAGKLAYLTNTKVRGACKQIEKASGTGKFLWEDGKLNDYAAGVTNQVPSDLVKGASTAVCSAMFFGNWADLIIGTWGSLDILVNPYAKSKSGNVGITAFQDTDIAVRHAESFAVCKDITTA